MDKPWWVLLFRWTLFLGLVGGGIFLLAHYQQPSNEGKIAGMQVSNGGVPLAKKVLQVIPPRWREKAAKQMGGILEKKKEENPWLQDVEQKINQMEVKISQFPHQSQKEIKKQLIQQACQELLREVDNEK